MVVLWRDAFPEHRDGQGLPHFVNEFSFSCSFYCFMCVVCCVKWWQALLFCPFCMAWVELDFGGSLSMDPFFR